MPLSTFPNTASSVGQPDTPWRKLLEKEVQRGCKHQASTPHPAETRDKLHSQVLCQLRACVSLLF